MIPKDMMSSLPEVLKEGDLFLCHVKSKEEGRPLQRGVDGGDKGSECWGLGLVYRKSPFARVMLYALSPGLAGGMVDLRGKGDALFETCNDSAPCFVKFVRPLMSVKELVSGEHVMLPISLIEKLLTEVAELYVPKGGDFLSASDSVYGKVRRLLAWTSKMYGDAKLAQAYKEAEDQPEASEEETAELKKLLGVGVPGSAQKMVDRQQEETEKAREKPAEFVKCAYHPKFEETLKREIERQQAECASYRVGEPAKFGEADGSGRPAEQVVRAAKKQGLFPTGDEKARYIKPSVAVHEVDLSEHASSIPKYVAGKRQRFMGVGPDTLDQETGLLWRFCRDAPMGEKEALEWVASLDTEDRPWQLPFPGDLYHQMGDKAARDLLATFGEKSCLVWAKRGDGELVLCPFGSSSVSGCCGRAVAVKKVFPSMEDEVPDGKVVEVKKQADEEEESHCEICYCDQVPELQEELKERLQESKARFVRVEGEDTIWDRETGMEWYLWSDTPQAISDISRSLEAMEGWRLPTHEEVNALSDPETGERLPREFETTGHIIWATGGESGEDVTANVFRLPPCEGKPLSHYARVFLVRKFEREEPSEEEQDNKEEVPIVLDKGELRPVKEAYRKAVERTRKKHGIGCDSVNLPLRVLEDLLICSSGVGEAWRWGHAVYVSKIGKELQDPEVHIPVRRDVDPGVCNYYFEGLRCQKCGLSLAEHIRILCRSAGISYPYLGGDLLLGRPVEVGNMESLTQDIKLLVKTLCEVAGLDAWRVGGNLYCDLCSEMPEKSEVKPNTV